MAKAYQWDLSGSCERFGFVAVEGKTIFYLEDMCLNGAFHEDQVTVTIKSAPDGKDEEGKVVRILS